MPTRRKWIAEKSFLPTVRRAALCERTTFSGKPVADMFPNRARHTAGIREGHIFEVAVTSGEVLEGLTKVYMVLFIFHDNEV